MVKERSGSVYQGAHLNSSLRVGIGFKEFIIGTGFIFGNTFKETTRNSDPDPKIAERDDFLLPFFSLGGGIRIGSNLKVDYVLGLYTSSFFRFSTTYSL